MRGEAVNTGRLMRRLVALAPDYDRPANSSLDGPACHDRIKGWHFAPTRYILQDLSEVWLAR